MAIRYASRALNDEGKVYVTVREALTNTPAKERRTNKANEGGETNADVERVRKWRKENPDSYRAYMRAYMAKRRKRND